MTLLERMSRASSPTDELGYCPGCRLEVMDLIAWYQGRHDQLDEWTCPVCYVRWDTFWMIDELYWSNIPKDFNPYTLPINMSRVPDDRSFFTGMTLCCSKPVARCTCSTEDYFNPPIWTNFLMSSGVSLIGDVYDVDTLDNENCLACEDYAQHTCMPYRNVMLYVKRTGQAPPEPLTPCQWCELDIDFVENVNFDKVLMNQIINGKLEGISFKEIIRARSETPAPYVQVFGDPL